MLIVFDMLTIAPDSAVTVSALASFIFRNE
jgi:hypothetical protein